MSEARPVGPGDTAVGAAFDRSRCAAANGGSVDSPSSPVGLPFLGAAS